MKREGLKKWWSFMSKHRDNFHYIAHAGQWSLYVRPIASGPIDEETFKQNDEAIKELLCARIENIRRTVQDDLLKLIHEVRAHE